MQFAVEGLARMVLVEDLRDVPSVQVRERADRVADPLDECVHRFLAHPPPRRDDFKDDGGGRNRLAEWPTHAGPHGHADILERSPSPAAPLFVSLRRNEKHNVLPAIVRIEAKGWAIEFGGGPSRSRSMTSRCATPLRTNSRQSANGWGWRSAPTKCGGFRRTSRASDATRPRWSSRASDRPGRNIAAA